MQKATSWLILGLFGIISCRVEAGINIPPYILECYRNNISTNLRALQVPLTSQVLIELVRNVEQNLETVLDMRTMASSMLHSLKFDGIQRTSDALEKRGIIPVGPTAIHFNMYKLLNDYLLPGEAAIFPMNTLSMNERCTLHYILSSSVQAWERGDESKTCPKEISIIQRRLPEYIRGKQKSICPIERGVMHTLWGDIAPGRLLTGIVAALYPQDVKVVRILKDFYTIEGITPLNQTKVPRNVEGKVDNVWAATVAGDLAEVVIFQSLSKGNRLILGSSGVWNDTFIPRAYYLPDSIGSHWEMTNAEMLGGIDGALIASKMKDWTDKVSSLRMSQVLDMYYSGHGVVFDPEYRACRRRDNFPTLMEKDELNQQVTAVSRLLAYTHVAYGNENILPPDDEFFPSAVDNAVSAFYKHLNELTDLNTDCEVGYHPSPMEILAVMDGTFIGYEGRRLISGISQAADVSHYGSSIGFISGTTGLWVTNVTHKVFNLFEDILRGETERTLHWPTSFSLTKGLETVSLYLQNETEKECTDTLRSTRTTVILVLANTAIPSDIDIEKSKSLVSTIKAMHPGTSIIYVTSESSSATYEVMAKNQYMNDYVVKTKKNIQDIVNAVRQKLREVPRQLMEVHCGISPLEYEDYIYSGIENVYEIPNNFIMTTRNIKVQFSGNDYGEISVCASDREKPEDQICKGILKEEEIDFSPSQMCVHHYACIITFKVKMKSTKFKCAEDDCRFPDMARIKIKTSWTSSSHTNKPNIFIITVILSFYTIFYRNTNLI